MNRNAAVLIVIPAKAGIQNPLFVSPFEKLIMRHIFLLDTGIV